jgi:excisionase family DNA binding protein
MTMWTTAELRVLHYFVRVADSVLPTDHASRCHLPSLLERILEGISISRERSDTDTADEESEPHDKVGTAYAAELLGCTQRRIQQRIKAGDIPAETVGRIYLINRRDIAA